MKKIIYILLIFLISIEAFSQTSYPRLRITMKTMSGVTVKSCDVLQPNTCYKVTVKSNDVSSNNLYNPVFMGLKGTLENCKKIYHNCTMDCVDVYFSDEDIANGVGLDIGPYSNGCYQNIAYGWEFVIKTTSGPSFNGTVSFMPWVWFPRCNGACDNPYIKNTYYVTYPPFPNDCETAKTTYGSFTYSLVNP